MLTRLGYRVTPRTDPIEALEAVMAQPDGFDLVVTDLTMPSLNGVTLTQRVRALRPDLPVILTTGYGATLTSERSRALGIRELVQKPMTLQALGEAVHRVLMASKDEGVHDSHLVGG